MIFTPYIDINNLFKCLIIKFTWINKNQFKITPIIGAVILSVQFHQSEMH